MIGSLKERLRGDQPLLCTFSILPSVEAVEIIALSGFDAVILDLEHGAYGVETVGPLVLAAHARGIHAVVRVLKNDPGMIGAVLDAGADGVLVPQVSTRAQAQAAVDAARFAPVGSRGANSWVRAAGFDGSPDWFAKANETVAVIVMIEGKAGVENMDEIIDTPSLDGVFLGPVDLSHSLGVPGQVDHLKVLEKMNEVIFAAKRKSLTTAVFAPRPEAGRRWIGLGVDMVACGVDTGHLFEGMRQVATGLRDQTSPAA